MYNAVWFALPIAALVICVVDPPAARSTVREINTWTRRHAHAVPQIVSVVVGVVLLVRGVNTDP